MKPYEAMRGVDAGPHQLTVPGRHEAAALTDACPRADCITYVRPVAVLDEVHCGKVIGRYGTYRCPTCDAAWLRWWAPASGMPVPTFRTWLRQFARDETALGDLARDVKADRTWPRGRSSLVRCLAHMNRVGASPEAIVTLRKAWLRYQHEARQ